MNVEELDESASLGRETDSEVPVGPLEWLDPEKMLERLENEPQKEV